MTGTARSRYLGQRVDHVQFVPGPLYHNGPFTIAAYALFAGNHLVISPRFSPEETLATIERLAVTNVVLVPTMMHRIVRLPDEVKARYDLSSLEAVLHMAAPCPAWLKDAWIDWIGAERIVEIYAATEGHASTMIRGDEWLSHRGSVGRCNLGEIQIVDSDSGAPLPAGRTGEVAYRSSRPTYRYVGADARHFPDGWEGLGDIGWMDADGYLYLRDRQSDMILSGGANIYPAEIESALLEHPTVQTCAVIGLPHDDLGSAVHAVVQGGDADELRAHLAERLAPYKVPRTFEFVAHSVRDDAGKVRRRQLREQRINGDPSL